jgi:hypothetical protein
MGKALSPGTTYKGRSPEIIPVNLSLERGAVEILQRHSLGKKAYGRLVSRLLYEYGEKQRIIGKITGALEETTVG